MTKSFHFAGSIHDRREFDLARPTIAAARNSLSHDLLKTWRRL